MPLIAIYLFSPGSIFALFLTAAIFLFVTMWKFARTVLELTATQLARTWSERLAKTIDEIFTGRYFSYKKRYFQHMIYRHRNFDVKGLSTQGIYTLELQQVFVDLSIVPTPAHRATANPLDPIGSPEIGARRSIWHYLKNSRQTLAVLGAPGSGKTTLLKYIALNLASKHKLVVNTNLRSLLPVLLFLREHSKTIISDSSLTLAECASVDASTWGPKAPTNWFESKLASGRCLVLLDGLDEVADPQQRHKVSQWVESQMTKYPRNTFVITSRPYGYRDNTINNVTLLEVRPFTGTQVERFIVNWYTATEIKSQQRNDAGVQTDAREGARDLLSRLNRTPALAELAVNPLLLTMIATVHRYRSSLPGRRVELYSEICEVCLGKRRQVRGLDLELTPAQKQRVLEPLAYFMMSRRLRDILLADATTAIAETLSYVSTTANPEDFLRLIQDTSGLLLERDLGIYSFAHLSFQEYLAAVHIDRNKLTDNLSQFIEDSWWHETILLLAAQSDATPFIARCLNAPKPSVKALALALQCAEEAREVVPSVRLRLDGVLDRGLEDGDFDRRSLVAQAVLSKRLRSLIRLREDIYIDTRLIENAEYQLFVSEERRAGRIRSPIQWRHGEFERGTGKQPALGIRLQDAQAFCNWLTARQAGEWFYRLPLDEEISEDQNPPKLFTDGVTRYWVTSTNGVCCLNDSQTSGISLSDLDEAFLGIDLQVASVYGLERDRDFILSLPQKWWHDLIVQTPMRNELRADDWSKPIIPIERARKLAITLCNQLSTLGRRTKDGGKYVTRGKAHQSIFVASSLIRATWQLVVAAFFGAVAVGALFSLGFEYKRDFGLYRLAFILISLIICGTLPGAIRRYNQMSGATAAALRLDAIPDQNADSRFQPNSDSLADGVARLVAALAIGEISELHIETALDLVSDAVGRADYSVHMVALALLAVLCAARSGQPMGKASRRSLDLTQILETISTADEDKILEQARTKGLKRLDAREIVLQLCTHCQMLSATMVYALSQAVVGLSGNSREDCLLLKEWYEHVLEYGRVAVARLDGKASPIEGIRIIGERKHLVEIGVAL